MTSDFFTANRRRLRGQCKPGSIIVLTAFTQMQGDNDQAAPFKQEANFWYLCGINEADWRLIIDVDSGDEWLVAPHRSFARQMFDGGVPADDAARTSGIKQVIDKREGAALLKQLFAKKKQAYTVFPRSLRPFDMVPNPAQQRLVAQLKKTAEVTDLRLTMARMRAIKQPVEVIAMQSAIDITLDALGVILPKLKDMHHEYEVDALLTYEFRRRGVLHGFDPIVAAGKNTCVLHHPLPKDPFVQNDWLLLDVGAEVDNYKADITRTIPLGQPSERHLQVYAAVQRMHAYALGMLKHGVPTKEYMQKAYQYAGEEMKKLGLVDKIKLDYTSVFKFMPHAVSHGLGIDTHDPLGQPETLQENMTLTVEVGIYIPQEAIGVRLEDDILITKAGATNMSGRVPIGLELLRKML
jgi:Xaa-Pro aminopeptidase